MPKPTQAQAAYVTQINSNPRLQYFVGYQFKGYQPKFSGPSTTVTDVNPFTGVTTTYTRQEAVVAYAPVQPKKPGTGTTLRCKL